MERITVSIPEEVKKAALEMAEEEGRSISSLFAEGIEWLLEEYRRRKAFSEMDDLIGSEDIDLSDYAESQRRMRKDDSNRKWQP